MAKYFFFDLETTGVNVDKHGIHQIAAIIETDAGRIELNYKVRPHDGCMVSPEALEIADVTHEELREYPPMREAYSDLILHLSAACDKYDKKDKFFLCGYNNAHFDNEFLRKFWERNGDKYFGSFFWSNSIDVMVLASDRLREERPQMENFKLRTVAKQLGLEVEDEKLHDAMYDVSLTKQMFEILTAEKVMEVSA